MSENIETELSLFLPKVRFSHLKENPLVMAEYFPEKQQGNTLWNPNGKIGKYQEGASITFPKYEVLKSQNFKAL